MTDQHTGGHGNTPAAWTVVVLVILGFCVGGVAIVASRPMLGIMSGGAIVVAGALVGKVMQVMGLGQTR